MRKSMTKFWVGSSLLMTILAATLGCSAPPERYQERVIIARHLSSLEFYCQTNDHPGNQQFSKHSWAEGTSQERGLMVRDLLCSKQVFRKSRGQVATLLGSPNREEAKHWYYRISLDRSFRTHHSDPPPPPSGYEAIPGEYELEVSFGFHSDKVWSLEVMSVIEAGS